MQGPGWDKCGVWAPAGGGIQPQGGGCGPTGQLEKAMVVQQDVLALQVPAWERGGRRWG